MNSRGNKTKGLNYVKGDHNSLSLVLTRYINEMHELNEKSHTLSGIDTQIIMNAITSDLHVALKQIIDFDNVSIEQLNLLGFRKITTSKGTNGITIYLIPEYILPILPIGLKVIDFYDGREIVYDGSNIDDEIDNGYLSVGLIPTI